MDAQLAPPELDRSPSTYFEPIFELGGPACRLMRQIGIIRGSGPSILRRSVAFWAITWVPMLVLALWDGHAVGPTPRTSFLLDFATYARIFVAVPLTFLAAADHAALARRLHHLRRGSYVRSATLIPLLARVRREGLRDYGMLTQRHNALFHRK